MPEQEALSVSEVLSELHCRLDHKPRRKDSFSTFGEHLDHVPHIVCVSGLGMSVQASAFHYCTPRESEGPWSTVEIGFPTERVEELMPYMEDWGDTKPTEAVYAYVPVEIVAQVIADNGGFAPVSASEASQ